MSNYFESSSVVLHSKREEIEACETKQEIEEVDITSGYPESISTTSLDLSSEYEAKTASSEAGQAVMLMRSQINTMALAAPMALAVKSIYPEFGGFGAEYGTSVDVGFRCKVSEEGKDPILYEAIQAHTLQENWKPSIYTASIWEPVVDSSDPSAPKGTSDDPIPFTQGMKIWSGLYYKEGDTDSIKTISQKSSMYDARTAAHTRAREILSDILTKERLTAIEKSSMTIQLDRLSKTETLGKIPYEAILFLGNGDDTETLVSFLRYYGINAGYTKFYGTAVWEGSDIAQDITMRGAKYATLPEISTDFSNLYEQMSGTPANRLASFGYDATNMAIGMIYSPKSNAAYLLDPSGYIGIDGLFRLKPTGENERALRIVQLSGDGTISTVREADKTFITPIYSIEQHNINPANDMALETAGVNPNDYINIPERLRGKYKSKTYGANITQTPVLPVQENIVILPEDDSDAIVSEDFKPVSLESVNRTYIDSVEIEE